MKKSIFGVVVLLMFFVTTNVWATTWGDTNNYYDNDYNITNQGGQGGDGGNAFSKSYSNSSAIAGAFGTYDFKFNQSIMQPIDTMQTNYTPFPLLTGGFKDYPNLPKNMRDMELGKDEKAKLIDVVNWIWDIKSTLAYSYIHLKDVEPTLNKLYDGCKDKKKFRFKVLAPDGSQAYGIGSNAGGVSADKTGLTSAGGSIIPGINRSDYDPLYIIWVYEKID
jgi:hypothetical protein